MSSHNQENLSPGISHQVRLSQREQGIGNQQRPDVRIAVILLAKQGEQRFAALSHGFLPLREARSNVVG